MSTLPAPPRGSSSYSHEQWELGLRTTGISSQCLAFSVSKNKDPQPGDSGREQGALDAEERLHTEPCAFSLCCSTIFCVLMYAPQAYDSLRQGEEGRKVGCHVQIDEASSILNRKERITPQWNPLQFGSKNIQQVFDLGFGGWRIHIVA